MSQPSIPDWNTVLGACAANYHAGHVNWQPASREFAMAMLECVPPRAQSGFNFATGEEWDCTDKGEPLYLCFRYDGTAFAARYMTLRMFNAEVLSLRK